MRIESLLIAALVCAGAPAHADDNDASRLELNVAVEATLVGLTFGARPELLVRLGGEDSVSRLRFAAGFFAGPEQIFAPFSFGYRAVFRPGHLLQPLLGAGIETQLRSVSDLALVRQFGVYVETGLAFALTRHWSVAAMFSFDLMLIGGPGVGFGPRIYAGYRF